MIALLLTEEEGKLKLHMAPHPTEAACKRWVERERIAFVGFIVLPCPSREPAVLRVYEGLMITFKLTDKLLLAFEMLMRHAFNDGVHDIVNRVEDKLSRITKPELRHAVEFLDNRVSEGPFRVLIEGMCEQLAHIGASLGTAVEIE